MTNNSELTEWFAIVEALVRQGFDVTFAAKGHHALVRVQPIKAVMCVVWFPSGEQANAHALERLRAHGFIYPPKVI